LNLGVDMFARPDTIAQLKRNERKNMTITITTKILNSYLETPILVSVMTYADYFFVPASIQVQIAEYRATLQTGHSYNHNDYRCLSNDLEIYDEDCDLILYKLSKSYESSIDNEFVVELNEECYSAYTAEELETMRHALFQVIDEAQQLIIAAEAVAAQGSDI